MMSLDRARIAVSFGICSFATATASFVGCSSSSDATPGGPISLVGGGPDSSVALTDGGAALALDGGAIDSGTSRVRFVHLAGELGGVDFCWRSSAADPFHGPILQTGSQATSFDGGASDTTDAGMYGEDASAGDDDAAAPGNGNGNGNGDAGGDASDAASANAGDDAGTTTTASVDAGPPPLTYLAVSNDLSLGSTGAVDIIAVEPGTGCAAPLVLSNVVLADATRTTLVLAGGAEADAAGALAVSAYADEIASADATRGAVRVINAALAPSAGPIALSFASDGGDVPLATNVQPRATGTTNVGSPAVDTLGYTLIAPLATAPTFHLSATNGGATFDTGAIASPPAAGSVHTAFVTEDATSFVVLWCDDLLSPSASPLR